MGGPRNEPLQLFVFLIPLYPDTRSAHVNIHGLDTRVFPGGYAIWIHQYTAREESGLHRMLLAPSGIKNVRNYKTCQVTFIAILVTTATLVDSYSSPSSLHILSAVQTL